MESPVAGCTMPSPMRAILSMNPGVRMAMPLPPQAPHWTLVPTLPFICNPCAFENRFHLWVHWISWYDHCIQE